MWLFHGFWRDKGDDKEQKELTEMWVLFLLCEIEIWESGVFVVCGVLWYNFFEKLKELLFCYMNNVWGSFFGKYGGFGRDFYDAKVQRFMFINK